MTQRSFFGLLLLAAVALTSLATSKPLRAADPSAPKPIPPTRPEMKKALDELKRREARLPLPPPTREEQEEGASRGRLGVVNNGRMRSLYLPEEFRSRGSSSRNPDPNLTFDYAFSTELFWIVSRVNNCHYCLGHQETKLVRAGLEEGAIAALDLNWSEFSPGKQAALAYARKLTFEPHRIDARDLEALAAHYSPMEILEITWLVSRYNATNRWTDSLGIPQEEDRELLTATAAENTTKRSIVAPAQPLDREPLESPEAWRQEFVRQQSRSARLPMVDPAETRRILELADDHAVRPHEQLVANFPVAGKDWLAQLDVAAQHGQLDAAAKVAIAWVAARHDRAWYAQGLARERWHALERSDEELFALEAGKADDPRLAAVATFAEKLTTTPQAIVDEDIAALRKHFNDYQTAEIVYHTTLAAQVNRLTEAAGLSWPTAP